MSTGGYRLGIDVGGTNTDAALLDADLRVVGSVKTPTTADTGEGVEHAIDLLLESTGCPPEAIAHAMLGTTHCTNAIVQRRGLGRVGVIRLGAPATTSVPPLEGWPGELRAAVEGGTAMLPGGHEIDGRPITEFDPAALARACEGLRGAVDAIAITGVFSPVVPEQERQAARIATELLGIPVSVSAEIGAVGLLERENATILNAALRSTLDAMSRGFSRALEARGVTAQIWFGQNDGTLMSLDYARRFPVLTIGCGPTNSIRGAAHLSRMTDGLVMDIGGTTTDIGVLTGGFPRQSAQAVDIGGIRTNFRMPDVLATGLGGGSAVHGSGRDLRVGPDSVGYRITSAALAFGGDTLTATDVALASGWAQIPGTRPVTLDAVTLEAARERIRAGLEDAVDRMKPDAAPIDVVLVGGGALIAPSELDGVARLVRPEHAGAANAIGAALGDIAGQAEQTFQLTETPHREAVAQAGAVATERAVAAGARAGTVRIAAIEEVPLAYSAGGAVTIRARAVGSL
ncbi:hydantoinase/oxoprolinase family protein [Sediminivirga luteola]|uniref:hydantoinase/oxoprolinase family protein n=1 Tax=Sediminivirga luteola TaxID=1774748 RepID=UPI001F576EE4|nr:hydantoinase/oxoprolinase family protein [Sediminivirga luteola]MCI2264285.1 hydantoinase/oxoprolinase family protein [Sediminivirga luteola]